MKDKRNCKIIQDLLPNYIEGLTNQETNCFIDSHLNECSDCENKCENMKNNLNVENRDLNKKAIDYFKKYNKKVKTQKNAIIMTIIIIILLLCIILGNMIKNYIIINHVIHLSENYVKSTNYELQMHIYNSQSKLSSNTQVYYKDGSAVINIDSSEIGNKTIRISPDKSYEINENNQIFEYPKEFTVQCPGPQTINLCGNWYEKLKFYATVKINYDRYNGKDCYCIKDLGIMWIDQQTGLILKEIPNQGYLTIDYDYMFNLVTDEDVEI